MWGFVGYGFMVFFVGFVVSCIYFCFFGSVRWKDVNYYLCFVMYVVYNIIVLVIGFRFEFNNNGKMDIYEINEGVIKDDSYESKEEVESGIRGIIVGFIFFVWLRYVMFLVIVFYVGIMMGFIWVFFFWYLKDLGGI